MTRSSSWTTHFISPKAKMVVAKGEHKKKTADGMVEDAIFLDISSEWGGATIVLFDQKQLEALSTLIESAIVELNRSPHGSIELESVVDSRRGRV